MSAPEVPEALTKEVGAGKFKFPVIVWAGIGVAGFLIARKVKGSTLFGGGASSSTATTPDAGAVIPPAGYGANGTVPVTNGAAGGGFDSGTASTITDNEQWRTQATNYLVSAGYDALAAANAIGDYLAGNPLTAAEQIMVEAALRRVGPTPEPVSPQPIVTHPIVSGGTGTPKPTPAPKPPPTTKPTPTPTPTPQAAPIQQTHALYTAKLKAAHASNERFVAFVNLQDGRGTWWLTNLGGVYSAGSAPYLGGPLGNGVQRTDWRRLQTLYPGAHGYRAIAADGTHMDFTQ